MCDVVAAVGAFCVGILGVSACQASGLPGWMWFYLFCALVMALLCLLILWKAAAR